MLGVLGPLQRQIPGQLVGRKDSRAQSPELDTGYQRLTVSTQRCPTRQRGQRAEPECGCGESEARQLADHSPNLGRDLARGYIPTYGCAGAQPPKIDPVGRR